MSFKNIKNIPNNIVVRQGYSGLNFPLKLGPILPNIVTQPVPLYRSVGPGLSTILAVEVTGLEPISYQWYKGSISNLIAGATSSSFILTGVTLADEGNYFVQATNAFGFAASQNVTVVVNKPVAITSGPQSLTAYYLNDSDHDKATFSITTSGTLPITYSWYKNSAIIGGATTPSYTASYNLSDNGAQYVASVQNFSTPVTAKATLTVLDTPLSINTQPSSLTVNPGTSSVTFTVAATGRLPISYQWRKNGTELLGLTTQNLAISNVQESDQAQYDVIVSNLSGLANDVIKLTSNSVLLDVNDPVGILVDLSTELYFGMGETITLSAQVSGTTPISYQWYKDNNEIVGATGSTYSINVTAESDLGQFYFVASNIVNSVTSNTGALYPAFPAGIVLPTTTQNITANPNSNVGSIYVYASGTAPISYQWYKNETLIPLATSTIYNILGVVEGDEGEYKVVVSNNWASVTSVPFILSVNNPVSFSQPLTGNEILMPGTEVVLYTVVSGTPPINYQWFKNNSLVVGATLSSYTIASITSEESGDTYQVVINNIVNTISSNVITLSVYQPVTITQQPTNIVSAFNATNDEATFTVTVTGSTPYVYNWYKDGLSVYTGGSSYTVDNGRALSTTDFGTYFVTVSNIVQRVTSDNVTLGGSVPMVITEFPIDIETHPGTVAQFTAKAFGGDGTINYQWKKDDVNIDGETLSSYRIDPVALSSQAVYSVEVSSVRNIETLFARLSVYESYGLWEMFPVTTSTKLTGFSVALDSGNIRFLEWESDIVSENITSTENVSHEYLSRFGFVKALTPAATSVAVGAQVTFTVEYSGIDLEQFNNPGWYYSVNAGPTNFITEATNTMVFDTGGFQAGDVIDILTIGTQQVFISGLIFQRFLYGNAVIYL